MATRSGSDETTAALGDPALLEGDAEELYEQAPAGYVSTLPGGLIVRVNTTLLSWTGYRREELLGTRKLQDLFAPGARIYYETHYAPLLEMQGEVREIAVELMRVDGSRLPVLLNSRLVRDDTGNPRIVRTTVFNASDRRRYERELVQARADAESRARAALALAHVNDGVLLVTSDGRLDVLNPAAERILGLSAATALGRPVREVLHEWDSLLASVPVGAPGDHIAPAALPLERDGHERWLALAGVDSEDGVVYTVRDVTSEHRLEELRNDLVATVSHELRTPLTGVSGAAQTLLAHYDGLDDDMRRQLLQVIVDQGERMARVVDQILLTSMLDAADASLKVTEFEASEAVADALAALPAVERVRISTHAEAGVLAQGDAARATQILGNLFDNALKYSPGPVRVSVAREGPFVRFTVDDDGPGIPAGERERIFDRFYRLDPAQHGGVGGAGLGLYIARKLAGRMDGRIGVLRGDGGTTMYLDLPAGRS